MVMYSPVHKEVNGEGGCVRLFVFSLALQLEPSCVT